VFSFVLFKLNYIEMIQLLWLLLVLMVCGGANGQSWVQLNDDINGEISGDQFGRVVAMSGGGTTVAVGELIHTHTTGVGVGSERAKCHSIAVIRKRYRPSLFMYEGCV
jgi:hypothetical protein